MIANAVSFPRAYVVTNAGITTTATLSCATDMSPIGFFIRNISGSVVTIFPYTTKQTIDDKVGVGIPIDTSTVALQPNDWTFFPIPATSIKINVASISASKVHVIFVGI